MTEWMRRLKPGTQLNDRNTCVHARVYHFLFPTGQLRGVLTRLHAFCPLFYDDILLHMVPKSRIEQLLLTGVQERIYPGAVLLVAYQGNIVFFEAIGNITTHPAGPSMQRDTLFDLASLTKPLGTVLSIMKCVDSDLMDLDQPLSTFLPVSVPVDKAGITPRMILSHCAGFFDWRPFYKDLVKHPVENRKQILRKWILEAPLAYPFGTEARYSDLGFMILEWIIEQCIEQPLHVFLERRFLTPFSLKKIFFSRDTPPPGMKKEEFAATEHCPWRHQLMQGVVCDENAYALGGYSGHAGMFGTAKDIYTLLNLLRLHFFDHTRDMFKTETIKHFFTRQHIVKQSTWALGWDTPTHGGSSSGRHFSAQSVGHLGFTGTSIWMELEKDVLVVFLTNRVHLGRSNDKIKQFRPMLHDSIMEAFVSNG